MSGKWSFTDEREKIFHDVVETVNQAQNHFRFYKFLIGRDTANGVANMAMDDMKVEIGTLSRFVGLDEEFLGPEFEEMARAGATECEIRATFSTCGFDDGGSVDVIANNLNVEIVPDIGEPISFGRRNTVPAGCTDAEYMESLAEVATLLTPDLDMSLFEDDGFMAALERAAIDNREGMSL